MKAKLLYTFILFAVSNLAISQVMQWENGEIKSPEVKLGVKQTVINYGSFSSFTINDINLFLYEVTIQGNRIDIDTPIPTELQTLFRLPSKQLNATTNSDAVTEAENTIENETRNISSVKTEVKKANEAAKHFNKTKSLKVKSKNVDDELEEALKVLDEASQMYLTAVKLVSTNIQKFKLARVKLINLAQTDVTLAEMRRLVRAVAIPADPVSDYEGMLDKYTAVQNAYEDVKKKDSDGEHTDKLEKSLEKIERALKKIEDENPITLFTDTVFLQTELQNKKNFTAVAPPVQADGDFINYKVTVTPTQTNVLGAHKSPVAFDFDIPVKGGWKTDFSVGPIFSFGKNAKDEKYFLEPSATPDMILLKQRNNNNVVSPGVAAMMHFYTRSGKDFNWGGMLGVGAGFQGTEDADVSFYTGVSFILGKSQKIMANLGISFLKVDRLKEGQYIVGTEYSAAAINLDDVTEKVLKGSVFLSVSYNLTNRTER